MNKTFHSGHGHNTVSYAGLCIGLRFAMLYFASLCCRRMVLATDGAHNVEWKWFDDPLSIVDEEPAMVMVMVMAQSPWSLQQGSENKMSLRSSGNAVTMLRPRQCPSTSSVRPARYIQSGGTVHRTSYLVPRSQLCLEYVQCIVHIYTPN